MVPCQPPVVELRMHLMQCVLTAQQEKQEGGQHYPVVLLDQRVLSPAGWQQSKKSVDMVTGGPPPPVGTLPRPEDRGGVAGAACVGAGATGGGIRAESHLQHAL